MPIKTKMRYRPLIAKSFEEKFKVVKPKVLFHLGFGKLVVYPKLLLHKNYLKRCRNNKMVYKPVPVIGHTPVSNYNIRLYMPQKQRKRLRLRRMTRKETCYVVKKPSRKPLTAETFKKLKYKFKSMTKADAVGYISQMGTALKKASEDKDEDEEEKEDEEEEEEEEEDSSNDYLYALREMSKLISQNRHIVLKHMGDLIDKINKKLNIPPNEYERLLTNIQKIQSIKNKQKMVAYERLLQNIAKINHITYERFLRNINKKNINAIPLQHNMTFSNYIEILNQSKLGKLNKLIKYLQTPTPNTDMTPIYAEIIELLKNIDNPLAKNTVELLNTNPSQDKFDKIIKSLKPMSIKLS